MNRPIYDVVLMKNKENKTVIVDSGTTEHFLEVDSACVNKIKIE